MTQDYSFLQDVLIFVNRDFSSRIINHNLFRTLNWTILNDLNSNNKTYRAKNKNKSQNKNYNIAL